MKETSTPTPPHECSLDDYAKAFADFMASGDIKSLTEFCEADTNADLLQIYRNGYYRSAIEALQSNYPSVLALLGEEFFQYLSKQYALQHPPTSSSMSEYGEVFAAFIEKEATLEDTPYLSSIAMLDRSWLQVYFAKDCQTLLPEDVPSLVDTSGNIRSECIALNPAADVVSVNYPVTEIWQELKDQGQLKSHIKIPKEQENVLLWRHRSEVLVRKLSQEEFTFFLSMKKGLGLERAFESIIEASPTFDLSVFFSNLLSSELLTLKS